MFKLLAHLLFGSLALLIVQSSSAQWTDKSKALVRESCPLSGSSPELSNVFTECYVVSELNITHELDSAYALLSKASNHLINSKDSAAYFFCLGIYNSRVSVFDEAQKNLKRAELLYIQMDDTLALLYTRLQLTNLNYYLKLEEEAYNEFKVLALHPGCDDYLKSKLHHNIGCLAMEVEREAWISPDTVKKNPVDRFIISHFDKAISYHRKSKNRSGLAATYSVYVNEMLNIGDLVKAKAYADSSVAISKERKDYARLAFARIKQGMILDTLGKKLEAIEVYNKAITYFDSIGNISQKIHAMSGKRQSEIDAGLMREAMNTTFEMFKDRSDFFDTELAEAHKRYELEYDTKKKQLTILEQEAELETRQLEISNRNTLLAATGFGTLSLGALLLLLLQRNKRKAREEKDALLIENKRKGIKAIIQAQEDERQRIAKDIHDGIVQQLGGLKMGLQKKLDAKGDSESKRLIAVLDDSVQELRELSHRMMPRALNELGLIPALTDMLENSLAHSEIDYEFENYGIDTRLPVSIEITLYRIAQELINNVIKHSRASRVTIQLFKSDLNVILIVEDDGSGFDSVSKKTGIGLLNISSRLDSVNGQVNFEPSPESGTLATIKIPMTT